VQEQAFTVVRNLAENEQGIDMLFRELGAEVLLRTITAALAAPDDDVLLQVPLLFSSCLFLLNLTRTQATYVLANLSNGIPQQALLLAHAPLLAALRTALAERAPAIRRPAVSAICELARGDSRGRRALVDAGVVSTLRALCYSVSHALPSSAMPSSPGGPGGGAAARAGEGRWGWGWTTIAMWWTRRAWRWIGWSMGRGIGSGVIFCFSSGTLPFFIYFTRLLNNEWLVYMRVPIPMLSARLVHSILNWLSSPTPHPCSISDECVANLF
jgi:hypothetical protein